MPESRVCAWLRTCVGEDPQGSSGWPRTATEGPTFTTDDPGDDTAETDAEDRVIDLDARRGRRPQPPADDSFAPLPPDSY